MKQTEITLDRRHLMGGVATAAAMVVGRTAQAAAGNDFLTWLGRIKGSYKQVFDTHAPNHGMALVSAWVYLKTGVPGFGVPETDLGAVVVLRGQAIPIALPDALWQKYALGEMFGVTDAATSAPATRNPFLDPRPGDMAVPDAGLEKLLARGVLVGACAVAIKVFSDRAAKQHELAPEAVEQEWIGALLPGVQLVPSGVVAVGGAQAHGCTYCYVGG